MLSLKNNKSQEIVYSHKSLMTKENRVKYE